jgi:hypothetical protein
MPGRLGVEVGVLVIGQLSGNVDGSNVGRCDDDRGEPVVRRVESTVRIEAFEAVGLGHRSTGSVESASASTSVRNRSRSVLRFLLRIGRRTGPKYLMGPLRVRLMS